jgi:site-specific DNA-adenine methylase
MSKDIKFQADAHVTRDYRSAVVLEEVLTEINDPKLVNRVNRLFMRFNKLFKDLTLIKNQQYYGSRLMREFEEEINKSEIPDLVKSLLLNVLKTKYKAEIIRKDN